ncbi:hypothetical protein [Sulfurospirillum oryzae]|uniref:hypothetical protein n=1 Tax=Sulfurospirillum oryzae TaxID=2976535 RepID=UPI0021E906B5|nr:hypothetical protein [Sulfurospirillum oryzae]
MNDRQLICEMLVNRYGMSFDIATLAKAIGVSKSKCDQFFMKFSDEQVIKNNILPRFKKIGRRRIWTAMSVASWLCETEKA